MKIQKKSGTYDFYTLEVSFTEMAAMLNSLETDHSNPISDEMYAAIKWYIERLPEPGSDETKLRNPADEEKELEKEGEGELEEIEDIKGPPEEKEEEVEEKIVPEPPEE
jgi:hypothetical protein